MTERPELDAPREQRRDQDVDHQSSDESPDAAGSPWATLAAAASAVGVSSKTIRRAVKAGTIDGHRSGDSPNSPWLVRLEDVEARWGAQAPAPDSSTDAATAQPVVTSESLNEAETVEVEADVKADIAAQPLRSRLSELRKRLVVKEPQRRWWQRRSR
ncbi:MAG: hypothetical protein IH850_03010 [Acidobacteria bacterium]|nr:hypothetical protein [Acidobacteriota bacterium]